MYKFIAIVTQIGRESYYKSSGKYTCGVTGFYLVSAMLSSCCKLFVVMIKLANSLPQIKNSDQPKHNSIFDFIDEAQERHHNYFIYYMVLISNIYIY